MIRALLGVLSAGCVILVVGPAARAQDEVFHYDRTAKKVVQTTGTIQEESAAGIKLKPATGAAGVREIPASDVVNVLHQTKLPRLQYRPPFTAEENAAKAPNAAKA